MLVNHLEHRNLAEAISKIISLETSDPKHAVNKCWQVLK